MSGDVQPRKRKDKKRKKDELGVEEPRGTAAVFGEGDVFMHSQHDHGTGGHWCAKIIFFSLLAILVGLIGLIILENRGLSELEANSVETRYSGVLDGWLEDAPDDDHHDEHTLELNHDDDDDGHDDHNVDDGHSDEDDEHDANDDEENDEINDNDEDEQLEQGDDDENEDEHDNEDVVQSNEDDEEDDDDDELENDESQEQDLYNDEDEDEEPNQDTYEDDDEGREGDEIDDDLQEIDDNDDDSHAIDENEEGDNSNEIDRNDSNEDEEESENQLNEEDEEHEEEEHEHDEEVEVEKLEKEIEEDLEPVSTELPALAEEDDDDDDDKNDEDQSDEKYQEDEDDSGIEDEDEEFLEADDADEPPVEKITVPAGEPFDEVEEDVSTEQPPDTLEEEEEYEKRQEELRREEAQASHMWLKLGVGGALLVATHAVMRRATHRDTPETEERPSREETPVTDRRLTLIPEESSAPARKIEPVSRPVVQSQVLEKVAPILKSVPIQKQESEEEEEEKQLSEDEDEVIIVPQAADDKELYSEEEADEDVEEEEEEEVPIPIKKEIPKLAPVVFKKPEPEPEPEPEEEADDEDPEDVEIIGDEQLEEELEEEGDDEEISDVDDAELLTRLEAKYGRLPEPERPGRKKDGGNSIDDYWPGEPADAYWRQQLDSAEQEFRQGSWSAAASRASGSGLRDSARARYILARALDLSADAQRDNRLLSKAITAYLDLLKMNELLSDKKLLKVTARTLDRIQFRGNYLNAEPVYRLLIRRFPNEPAYRNNLTISFLMANRIDLAEEVLKETLQRWPKDRVALAHYGFVLKTKHNKYEEAAEAFKKALEGDTGPANENRFYYHYGDSLLLLGRHDEAREIHERGAKLGHFLSPSQRSLYNVARLKSSPWWDVDKTPYKGLAKALEHSWKEILKEGQAAKALYEKEKEGLKERGEWSQLDLFVRGQELPDRCARAQVTCSVVKSEPAAAGCRRGQIKFSLMAPGTHVRAHVGPTNCRLRMHLGLSNTKDTYIRVDKEIRQWQVGKVLMFDDSFEHEVWHNGTGPRLVLIVDVWHPDLTPQERRQLPAI